MRYDGKVPEVRLPPQKLGAQSEEILQELGYGAQQLKDLFDKGAVGIPADEAPFKSGISR
ncbi:hypothetical protein GALL_493640 [mine drainage metagenome]|uniref:Formyl-CoA transferase n=1 Tax=mine drainage metagenome TaxID=410659 RepID=A0A1J5PN71_9ZZZZ